MYEQQEAARINDDGCSTALQAVLARVEAGATVGLIAFELHPDGTATRHVFGNVRSDGYRVAGMAFALAQHAVHIA